MKVTAKDIYLGAESLKTILDEKLPIQIAYNLSKTTEEVSKIMGIIEEERVSIVTKYGKKDKKNGGYIIPENDLISISSANNDFTEYLESEIDVNISKIDISELGNIELTVSDIQNLKWLFK